MHNIGLIARHLSSKKHNGNVIRSEVISKALELWSRERDTVARSISTCLKLGRPNYSSYRSQIRRFFLGFNKRFVTGSRKMFDDFHETQSVDNKMEVLHLTILFQAK